MPAMSKGSASSVGVTCERSYPSTGSGQAVVIWLYLLKQELFFPPLVFGLTLRNFACHVEAESEEGRPLR